MYTHTRSRDAIVGMGVGHLQVMGLFGVDFGGTLALFIGGLPAYVFLYSLGHPGDTHAQGYVEQLGFTVAMPPHRVADPLFFFRNACGCAISLLWAAAVWRSLRTTWAIESSHKARLSTMRTVLLDLLPAPYLQQLIKGCDYIRPSQGRAVVLQLDLCDFTVLSQQHPPEKLANMVNGLICDFDECVLASIGHMIKVDTIGDACIGETHACALGKP